MRIAAIDQGTTSTRAMTVEGAEWFLSDGIRHKETRPRVGWVEQDPSELLGNVRTCIRSAGKIDAIGLANQGESCLAWDAITREPISPVISWQDSRTAKDLHPLRSAGYETDVLSKAGVFIDAYFSASKLAWILKNVPAAQAAQRKGRLRLGTTDAFFLDNLTGNFVTDVTTASRTSLLNLASLQWDAELCDLFGVPITALPEIRPTMSTFGSVEGIPILASVVDQQASLFGHGCRRVGDMKVTFGTGAFALAVAGGQPVRQAESRLLSTIAWQSADGATYALDGGVYDAGSSIEWIRSLGLFKEYAEIEQFAGEPAIESDLTFVPALSGLASPHWDRTGGALWIGMTGGTTRLDLCRAVLEGIALRTSEVIAEMDSVLGAGRHLSIDGGLSKNRYFVQFLADSTGKEIWTYAIPELTAYGCASMARACLDPAEPSTLEPILRTSPSRDGFRWRLKYAEAVGRARSWRKTKEMPLDP